MTVRFETSAAIATVTIDRPERRNAVDCATARELRTAYDRFAADSALRVLVVCGAGGTFCAGADLKAFDNDLDAAGGPMGFTHLAAEKPTIAAIEGYCVAGGLEIAALV